MTDILINEDHDLVINALGDFELVDDVNTRLQNIRERLLTPIKNLFFDPFFGSEIINYIHTNLFDELESSIVITLQQEHDIDPHSLDIEIDRSDEELRISITFEFFDSNSRQSISLNITE
ncbi:MAG: hypothetical protein ACRCTJ_03455 [Brevinema sp.]